MPATFLDSGLRLPGRRPRAAWSPLMAASACSAVLFLLLCARVWSATGPLPFDAAAEALLSPGRGPALLASFAVLTLLGSGNTIVVAGLLASAWLGLQRRWRLAAIFWCMLAGSGVTTWMAKVLVARARPDFVAGFAASSPSFPSSHAAGALAAYGFLAYALGQGQRPSTRAFAATAAALLVLVVAASRLVLGLHHASDVAGGLLLAASWLLAGLHMAARGSASPAPAPEWRGSVFAHSIAGSR